MILLAQEPELRASMGQAGQQMVNENYSWQVISDRLDLLLLFFRAYCLILVYLH